MKREELEEQRRRLVRTYELTAEGRMRQWGYVESESRAVSGLMILKLLAEHQFLHHYFGRPPGWRLLLRRLGRGERTVPDFAVVGPIKAGTSDLAVNLMLHPNVIPPFAKEPGPPCRHLELYYPTRREKERHAEAHGDVAKSPFLAPYLHQLDTTRALHRANPDAKVVIVLREPARRLYSHWKWERFCSQKDGPERRPFLRSFDRFAEELLDSHPVYDLPFTVRFHPLRSSIYWKSVQIWIDHFGRDNVLVLDVADYFADRHALLHEIYEFVGLPDFDPPDFDGSVNDNPLSLPPPDEPTMQKLREFFRPHNDELWEVIGKRFDW